MSISNVIKFITGLQDALGQFRFFFSFVEGHKVTEQPFENSYMKSRII